MICAALCFDCPPWEPQLGGFLFGEKTKEVVAPVHFDWTLDNSRSKSTAYSCWRIWLIIGAWLIGWLYVVGWSVGMWLEKNIKSAPMSYTCLCFMFLYRQYCNYLIWESIKLEIGWFLISLCCICRTSYKKPEWQIQLIFYCVMTDTRHLFDENATKVN